MLHVYFSITVVIISYTYISYTKNIERRSRCESERSEIMKCDHDKNTVSSQPLAEPQIQKKNKKWVLHKNYYRQIDLFLLYSRCKFLPWRGSF